MSRPVGIANNVQQRIISGARVAFDPRTTAEVTSTVSSRNGKADERLLRKMLWRERQRDSKSEAA